MSSGCGDVLSLEDLKTAKKHQLFEAEVITGKSGGVAGGADIDYATNQVTGQTQKTMPAVLRDVGFEPASFTFDTGGTLGVNDADVAVLWPGPGGDGQYYVWRGALPKVIPASSTPATAGGVSSTTWVPWGDITLRNDLLALDGAGRVGGATYAGIRAYAGPLSRIRCLGRVNVFDGGNGIFNVDTSDTTSADNDGTILVDALGRRWKREYNSILEAAWFGYKADGVTDDTAAINRAIATIPRTATFDVTTRPITLFFKTGVTKINGQVLVRSNLILSGYGVSVISDSSNALIESGYYKTVGGSEVFVSNFDPDLSDVNAINNRIVGLVIQGFTFSGVTSCIKLRATNEMSELKDLRFFSCGSCIFGRQNFFTQINNLIVRLQKDGSDDIPAIDMGNALNEVTFNNVKVSSRNRAYRIGVGSLGTNDVVSASIKIAGGSIETCSKGIELVGRIHNLEISNVYAENVTKFVYDEDGDLKYYLTIHKNNASGVYNYVDLGGLRNGFIGAVTDGNPLFAETCTVKIRGDGFGSLCKVELPDLLETSLQYARYELAPSCITVGYTQSQSDSSGNFVVNDVGGCGMGNSSALISELVHPIKTHGWFGVRDKYVAGGALLPTEGIEMFVNTDFKFSQYNSISYSLKITPNAGSGSGGSTPAPIYLSGIVIGDKIFNLKSLSTDNSNYISVDAYGLTQLHFTGFVGGGYDWMRAGNFTSEGIIKLI